MKTFSFCVLVLASTIVGAEPRLAVHPLDVGNVTPAQREQVKAHFEVMVARINSVKFAGSARLDEALGKNAAARCEQRDSCLRFLAEATESLYGMYVRADWQGDQVVTVARIVRVDGAVLRRVSVKVKNRANKTVPELMREALTQTLAELKLEDLPSTIPDDAPPALARDLPPPPVVPAPEPPAYVATRVDPTEQPMPFRKVMGWGLVGVGGAALATGVVFGGLSAAGMAANPHDAAGIVAPDRAAAVDDALRQSQIATILIPTGIAVAAIGALVVLIPSHSQSSVALSVAPARDGLFVSMAGAF